MIGGTSQRIHILKAARVGTTKAINRPKCHGHIGWKVMQKNCGKQRNESQYNAPWRICTLWRIRTLWRICTERGIPPTGRRKTTEGPS